MKFSIPTEYKGIKMRSRLEANMAFLLDGLKIEWLYEPQSFLLSNGRHYLPDFYLPELNTYIEVKGVITDEEKELMKTFSQEQHKEILIISSEEGVFFEICENENKQFILDNNIVYLGFCSKCHKFFFCGSEGSYHCRNCNFHNGDGDMVVSDLFSNYTYLTRDYNHLDLSNINLIKKLIFILIENYHYVPEAEPKSSAGKE